MKVGSIAIAPALTSTKVKGNRSIQEKTRKRQSTKTEGKDLYQDRQNKNLLTRKKKENLIKNVLGRDHERKKRKTIKIRPNLLNLDHK